MSRLSSFIHRIFGGTARFLGTIAANVVGPAVAEIRSTGARSDEEIRAIVARHVSDYLTRNHPEYGWIVDKAVDYAIQFVRMQLRKR